MAKLEETSSFVNCSILETIYAWKEATQEISTELFFELFSLSDILLCFLQNFSIALGPFLLLLLEVTPHLEKPGEDEGLQVIVTEGGHDEEAKVAKTVEESPNVTETVKDCVDGSRVGQNVGVLLEDYEADIRMVLS